MQKAAGLLIIGTLTASAQTTKSYDVTRSNLNSHETSLTAAAVSKMPTAPKLIPCRGDARGCETQPIVDDPLPRPVMILASEANIIRGVDPDGGAAIWETPQLCTPIRTESTVEMWGINFYIGMMGTGDADTVLHRLYQVATYAIKTRIMDRLRIAKPGPAYMHFPVGTSEEYFSELTAESRIPVKNKKTGVTTYVWYKNQDRNETLDLTVYAHAGLWILQKLFDRRRYGDLGALACTLKVGQPSTGIVLRRRIVSSGIT